jgi:hypothetical protein
MIDPDVAELIYRGAARKSPGQLGRASGEWGGQQEWDTVISLSELTVPPFPVDVFPSWLAEFVGSESVATQTPADLAGMLVVAVLAAACGGAARAHLKEGHEEPLNLFVAVVLPPGNRKSSVFREVTEPIERFEADESERLRPLIQAANQQKRILLGRLKNAEERATKGSDPDGVVEATRVRIELESLGVPVLPRSIVDDCSTEKLASLLAQNRGSIAQLSAEGGVFDTLAGRYSRGQAVNLDVYLKGHAGDTLRVDRVGRESEIVRAPALTLGLAVQPARIHGLMRNPDFRGLGLCARFLYAMPRSTIGHRDVNAPAVPAAIRAAYSQGILRILRILRPMDPQRIEAQRPLTLAEDAQAVLRNFERELEPRLGEGGDLSHIADWASKLAGAIGRTAGLLHIADYEGNESAFDEPIGVHVVLRAIRLGEYLIPHALAAFGVMGANPGLEDAKHLLAWIRRSGLKEFTKRTAFEATKGRFGTVSAMASSLAILEEHRCIRVRAQEPRAGAGRRPSPTYEVHPDIAVNNSQDSQKCVRSEGFGRPALESGGGP